MNKVFRKVFMGGFRKRDVVAYLDKLAKDHQAELDDWEQRYAVLEKQLNQSNKQHASDEGTLSELRLACSDLENKAALLSDELAKAQKDQEESATQLSKVEALSSMRYKQTTDLFSENEALKKQLTLLNSRMAALEQVQQEHEGLKHNLLRLEKTAKHTQDGSFENIRARLNQIAEELSMLAREAGSASIKTAVRTPVRPQGQPTPEKELDDPYFAVHNILSRIRQGKTSGSSSLYK